MTQKSLMLAELFPHQHIKTGATPCGIFVMMFGVKLFLTGINLIPHFHLTLAVMFVLKHSDSKSAFAVICLKVNTSILYRSSIILEGPKSVCGPYYLASRKTGFQIILSDTGVGRQAVEGHVSFGSPFHPMALS